MLRQKPMASYKEAAVQGLAEDICEQMPPGYVMSLCFEDGAASVQVGKDGVGFIEVPDAADRSLFEQLDDALRLINGR